MAMERKFLFTGSDDMTIIIWNMLKGNRFMVGKLDGHKDCK
jgi:WD40 repeat protein